jgi:hypothetical protein
MNRSTLPRRGRAQAPGWSHPYSTGPFSPVFYADGDPDPDADLEGGPDPDADPAGDGDPDPDADPDGDPDPEGADDLGDKGKKALDSMKTKLRAERERRRIAESERDRLKAKPAGEDGAEGAEQIRAEADRAATARANTRIVRSEVRAAAAGKLADPKDALTFLDLDQFEVDEDGQVDEDEIADAIDDLVKNKPYLAAATAKRFQGTGDGGAARKAGRPKQLTQQDLKTMSAEAIDKARIDGRLDDLMGGK